MTIRQSTLSALVFLVVASSFSAAEDKNSIWHVGLATANITPGEPVRMAGYASNEREQLSQGVASTLAAKAMVIEDPIGNKAILITTDVIGLTAAVSEPLYQRITAKTGLKRDQILINSSHTHTGPVIGIDEESLHELKDSAHIKSTIRYTQKFSDQIVDLAVDATSRLEPSKLAWGTGVATFVMNRREFTDRGVRLGVNPRGPADRGVPVLKVESESGKLRCVLIGTACHNTTLGGSAMQISGDFAGYAQHHVEQQIDGVQAMFLQGCGGDANPYPRGTEDISRIHGLTLGKEVLRVLETELAPIAGPLETLLTSVDIPLQQNFTADEYDKLERASGATRDVALKLRERLASDGKLPASYQTQIAFWQFGEDLTLVALPGEVVVDYVRMIEDAIGPRKLWVSAYNHDVFGYLPSARVLREGGYEIRGIYAGGLGIFSSTAEQVVIDKVKSLSEKSRRPREN